MSPADFLEFRGYLTPASGFQSVQFRVLENVLGLPPGNRRKYHKNSYLNYFKEEDKQHLHDTQEQTSLLRFVVAWLERTPFIEFGDFDFWKAYRESVNRMLSADREMTMNNPLLDENSRQEQLSSQETTEKSFEILFDEKKYNELYDNGDKRLSYKACKAALFIFLYRDQPVLNLPYRFLTLLTDIDELLTTWRYRHVMMVQRMIGVKLGTGGSSGYYYLKSTLTDSYKIFLDLFHLSTYLIPNSQLPILPPDVKKSLGFSYYENKNN
jgi:tryptophan 2,3-dioxygenase